MNNKEAGVIMKNLFNKHLVKHEPAEPAADAPHGMNQDSGWPNSQEKYEVIPDKTLRGDWLVKGEGHETSFRGPDAEHKAREFARRRNEDVSTRPERSPITGNPIGTDTVMKTPYDLPGSTRPEMPPAEVARRIYNEVPFTISEKEWIERSSIILAASVQQEPLSASIEKAAQEILQLFKDLIPGDSSPAEIVGIIFRHITSAASRTQGRAWADALQQIIDFTYNISPEDYLTTLYAIRFKAQESLAQARTQPAPRTPACPLCGSTNFTVSPFGETLQILCHGENCGNSYSVTYPVSLNWFSQFFTALPEATNEEK